MTIDLREASDAVLDELEQAVAVYTKLHTDDPRANPPATRLDIVYDLGDGSAPPTVWIHIDTSTDAEPNGEWTHQSLAMIEFEEWTDGMQACFDEQPVALILPDGDKQPLDNVEEQIGHWLVAILMYARDDHKLAKLPRGLRCELGVAESNGEYAWPAYEDRRKENLL